MDVKVAGFIEELHCDEEGRRVIDKFRVEHISLPLVIEDEVVDALEICGDECHGCRYGSCDTCPPLSMEIKDWDELSDEALEEFEKLVEESEPSSFWEKIRNLASVDDWIDWLMGK